MNCLCEEGYLQQSSGLDQEKNLRRTLHMYKILPLSYWGDHTFSTVATAVCIRSIFSTYPKRQPTPRVKSYC